VKKTLRAEKALFANVSLAEEDPEVARIVEAEKQRQIDQLELIASENYSSAAVREAAGSVLTDKYAEGYPGARWYGGCECVDAVEELAVRRACQLFGAEHANVQPHSGTQANMAVYMSVLKPSDKIMGMSLSHGGHLTHGNRTSFSGWLYQVVKYGVDRETCLIDYDEVHRLAQQHKPRVIVAGASAYSREIDFRRFRKIADDVHALLVADMAHIAGLVAAGLHDDPVPHADFVTSTTHKTLRGPRGGFILCKEGFAKSIDSSVCPGIQGGPMMHMIAAKAVAFKEAMQEGFRDYQEQIVANARTMADELMRLGLKVVTGGTDNHLFLLDLTDQNISGRAAERALARAHVTVNKNAIPFDPRSPVESSGVRIGTPAVTARGMKEEQMQIIAGWIAEILLARDPNAAADAIQPHVVALCRDYLPPCAEA